MKNAECRFKRKEILRAVVIGGVFLAGLVSLACAADPLAAKQEYAKVQKRLDQGLGKRAMDAAQKQIKQLQGQSFFKDASSRQFKNPTAAGRFFEHYSKLALANKLKARRQERKLTQLEIAKRIGSSQSRIAKMEVADKSVSLDLLVRSLLSLGATRQDIAGTIGAPIAKKRSARPVAKKHAVAG